MPLPPSPRFARDFDPEVQQGGKAGQAKMRELCERALTAGGLHVAGAVGAAQDAFSWRAWRAAEAMQATAGVPLKHHLHACLTPVDGATQGCHCAPCLGAAPWPATCRLASLCVCRRGTPAVGHVPRVRAVPAGGGAQRGAGGAPALALVPPAAGAPGRRRRHAGGVRGVGALPPRQAGAEWGTRPACCLGAAAYPQAFCLDLACPHP